MKLDEIEKSYNAVGPRDSDVAQWTERNIGTLFTQIREQTAEIERLQREIERLESPKRSSCEK